MVEVVCHRGANAHAPENTYASTQYCIDWGADWLEIDVNTSRDGVMYVFHGPDLARTTSGIGKIHQMDSADLDPLDCGSWFATQFSNERMPRLDEFLDWLDGRIKLFLDVKWAPLEDLVQLIDEKGFSDNSFFWFGQDKLARRFREIGSNLDMKINVGSEADLHRAIEDYDAKIVEFGLNGLSARLIDASRHADIRSMIRYAGDHEKAFASILTLGPDMANIDHADVFCKMRMGR
jgi:glycerophosphoryl diester phosphodiesterase